MLAEEQEFTKKEKETYSQALARYDIQKQHNDNFK